MRSEFGCRRLAGAAALGISLAVMATGCGTQRAADHADPPATTAVPGPPPAADLPVVTAPTTPPSRPPGRPVPPPMPTGTAAPATVRFATPVAAMRFLAAAYNDDDVAAMKKVTTPDARAALLGMRPDATNLQLEKCDRRPQGDYVCEFQHDFPPARRRAGHGHATFLAAPADKPGWYMTVLIDCD